MTYSDVVEIYDQCCQLHVVTDSSQISYLRVAKVYCVSYGHIMTKINLIEMVLSTVTLKFQLSRFYVKVHYKQMSAQW